MVSSGEENDNPNWLSKIKWKSTHSKTTLAAIFRLYFNNLHQAKDDIEIKDILIQINKIITWPCHLV